MWRHVCLRNPFSPFLFGIPSIHSPWEPQHAPPTPHFCIIPKFVVAEENLSHAEKQRVWSQSCGVQKVLQCTDCAPLWPLQTKILASAGWKGGCEHFSYRCSHHVTTCLFQDPFPPFRFGIPSIHSLPEAWCSWEPQYAPPILHYACIMPIASLQLQKKASLMQRSKGFGHGVVCYIQCSDCVQGLGYRVLIVLSVVTRDSWLLQTNEIQWTIVEIDKIEILASVGWKRGCQPFSCPCSRNVMHCRKKICLTCLSKESMPFVKSKPPLPTRSLRSLRAAVCSNSSALCLYHAHPFVAAAEKRPVSCREAKGLVTELWSPRFVMYTYNTVIVSKVWVTGYWLCSQLWHVTAANQWNPMNNCRDWQDWDFSIRGLEVGLPAFQLPMFSKCDALPKADIVWHVCLRNPCLLWNLSLHCLPEAWGPWEPQYAPTVLHHACIMPIPSLQLQKKDQSHAEKQRVWSRSCGLQELLQYTDCSSMNAAKKAFSLRGLEWGCRPFSCPWSENDGKCDALPKGDLLDMFVSGIHACPIPGIFFCKDIQLIKRSESQ